MGIETRVDGGGHVSDHSREKCGGGDVGMVLQLALAFLAMARFLLLPSSISTLLGLLPLQLLLLLLERRVLLPFVLNSTDLVCLCQLLPFSGEVALVP